MLWKKLDGNLVSNRVNIPEEFVSFSIGLGLELGLGVKKSLSELSSEASPGRLLVVFELMVSSVWTGSGELASLVHAILGDCLHGDVSMAL